MVTGTCGQDVALLLEKVSSWSSGWKGRTRTVVVSGRMGLSDSFTSSRVLDKLQLPGRIAEIDRQALHRQLLANQRVC